MSYEPPIQITIPIPSKIDVGYGPESTGKRGGNLRIRCTNKEYDLIKQEAEALDVSIAAFCRWCSVRMARTLEKHRTSQSVMEKTSDSSTD